MFNRPTVLIIGAGASSEFDMPLGYDLVSRVANAVVPDSPLHQELRQRIDQCLGGPSAERLLKVGPRLAGIAPCKPP
jgi:hypothetical protein